MAERRPRAAPTVAAGALRHGRRWAGCVGLIMGFALVASSAQAAALASRSTSPDWSRYIVGLLPAIEVCMREAPSKPAVVTGAYRIDGAMIGVRLRGPARERWLCTAPANGNGASRYEPLTPDDRRPGEGDPLLTFGGAPEGDCRSNQPLVDPKTGQLIGWFSYETC